MARVATWGLAASLSVWLAACGGGSGSGSGAASPAVARASESAPVQATLATRAEPYTPDLPAVNQGAILTRVRAAGLPLNPLEVTLASLDAGQARTAMGPAGGRFRSGIVRELPFKATVDEFAGQLRWSQTAQGTSLASVHIKSTGAKSVRLGLVVHEIPLATSFRLYAASQSHLVEVPGAEIMRAISQNQTAGSTSGAGKYFMPAIEGDEVTMEIELAPGVRPAELKILPASLAHSVVDTRKKAEAELLSLRSLTPGQSASCENDIRCTSGYDNESNSVAVMEFVSGDYMYHCTGTLMADTNRTGRPYFLTANHCISSQAEATSLATYWFYRSSNCNSTTVDSAMQVRRAGATLLYNSAATDTSFMLLNEMPPAGATYAGWDTSLVGPNVPVVGVHHPSADLQKISYGSSTGNYFTCTMDSSGAVSCQSASSAAGGIFSVVWSSGITEAGSSGSPLFRTINGSRYVIGQLFAGGSFCGTQQSAPDIYGRFDMAYSAALNRWLDPASAVKSPIYRFYNTSKGAHFFTINAAEKDYVTAHYPVFSFEGTAFYAYTGPGLSYSPVYRFYNNQTGVHFYTFNSAERDHVLATYPQFVYEGISWYALASASEGASPVYRFYNTQTGTHFYTISSVEKDNVIARYPQFSFEGAAYYAWP